MKKRIQIILSLITVLLLCLCIFVNHTKDSVGPQIYFSKSKRFYADDTNTLQLLNGVRAVDGKDGNVTNTVRVLLVIPDNAKKEVTVEYIAKDHSNNITKSSCVFEYTGSRKLVELNEPSSSETQETARAEMNSYRKNAV